MDKKKSNESDQPKEKPEIQDKVKGLELKINEFGEVVSSVPTEKLNEFLDDNLEDRKLKDRT